MAVRVVCSVSPLCVEAPSRDTPEIASLRLVCAHPCAQTVPRGGLDTESADGTRVVDGVSAVVPQFAPWRNYKVRAA